MWMCSWSISIVRSLVFPVLPDDLAMPMASFLANNVDDEGLHLGQDSKIPARTAFAGSTLMALLPIQISKVLFRVFWAGSNDIGLPMS